MVPQAGQAPPASVALRRSWAGACRGPRPPLSANRLAPAQLGSTVPSKAVGCGRCGLGRAARHRRHTRDEGGLRARRAHFLVSPTGRMGNPVQGGAKGGRRGLISEIAKAGGSVDFLCCWLPSPRQPSTKTKSTKRTNLTLVHPCQPNSPTQGGRRSAPASIRAAAGEHEALCLLHLATILLRLPPPLLRLLVPRARRGARRWRRSRDLRDNLREPHAWTRIHRRGSGVGGQASGAAPRGAGAHPLCPPSPPVARPSSP